MKIITTKLKQLSIEYNKITTTILFYNISLLATFSQLITSTKVVA